MDLSLEEKSIVGSLLLTVGLFGYYFIQVIEVFTGSNSVDVLGLPKKLIGIVIALVVVEIVYYIAIALTSPDEDADERDKLIEAKATRISYFVLAAGCITTIGHLFFSRIAADMLADVTSSQIVFVANLLVFSFIVAEVVGFAMQLHYRRRGV